MSRPLKAHILLVLVTLTWGASFVIVKVALNDVSPLLFNALRMTLAAVILGALFFKEFPAYTAASIRSGVIAGILLFLGFEFQTVGLKLTTPSKSAFLTGISVVLVPVFLALLWRRRTNRWTALGVLAAFLGLFFLTVPAGRGALGNWSSINLGDALTLGCAVAFAFQIIYLGEATRRHSFRQIAFLQAATSAVAMFAVAPALEKTFIIWSPAVIAGILVTGVLCTAAAFTIQAWAQQFTPPTHTALIFALEPVFAGVTSYLVLGERLGMRALVGAVLILGGILLSELKGVAHAPAGETGLGDPRGQRPLAAPPDFFCN